MVRFDYRQDVWSRAADRAAQMPIYAGSHRRGAANELGALGEVIFEEFLRSHGIPFDPRYETTEDLLLFDATVEVKTKDRTVNPQPHYECSVPLYNHEHQRSNGTTFWTSCRNLRIDQLRKLPQLLEACERAKRNAGGHG